MSAIQKPGKKIFLDWKGYPIAIGLVALATWLKYLAQPNIIPTDVPILYIVSIVITATFWGFGPSIFVSILSLIAYDFFFIPPLYSLGPRNLQAIPILLIFLLVAVMISYLSSNLRQKNRIAAKEIAARKKTEAELIKYRDHLEDLVKQRTAELEKANLELKEEISERKKAEEEVRKSEQRWATTLASIGDAVIATDVTGGITFMNAVAEDLTGWTIREAATKPITEIFDIVNEYTRQKVDNPVNTVLQKGIIVGLANHTILVRKNGTEIAIDDSGAPIKDERGDVTGVVLIFRDVTERKKSEDALLHSEEQLKRSQEIAHLGSWELDLEKNSLSWSDEVYRIFGLKPQEFGVTYEAFLEAVHPEDREAVDAAYSGSIREGKDIYEIEHRVVRKSSGEIRYVYEKCQHVKGENGRILRSIGIVHDITERKEVEEALRQRSTELAMAYKELEAFSYSVSHDLRAPLRSIDGFSQAVLEDYADKLDKEGKDYLYRIRESSQLMARLIDDILRLSRVVRADFQPNRVNLSEMANSISTELKRVEPQRRVEFNIMAGVEAVGDANLLRIALENLINNAFKFTSRCQIAQIDFGVKDNNGEKLYYIRDNGAGFDMKYADKLFKPFERLHSASQFAGTGIGLATVQRIITRHGGRLWAKGEVEKGATFYFTLKRDGQ